MTLQNLRNLQKDLFYTLYIFYLIKIIFEQGLVLLLRDK